MPNNTKTAPKLKNILLILAIIGFLAGTGLLVLAKYMLTNYASSLAQTYRSHIVNVSGKLVLLLSFVLLVVYIIELFVKSDSLKRDRS